MLVRRHRCFVLNMSGESLLSLVKNNSNILVFLLGSQTDLLNHLYILTKAGTSSVILFSVIWSLGGACRGKAILVAGKQAGWQSPCPASYLPNYIVSSSSSDIEQSYGDKHRGGNRWGKEENFPLIGLVIAFSVSLPHSGVWEKGKGFRYKLKYMGKR